MQGRGAAILAMAMAMGLATLAHAAPTPCGRVIHPVLAGGFVTSSDFEPADCVEPQTSRSFTYDPIQGLARARRDLTRGEIVRTPPAFALAAYRPGDRLLLAAESGSIAVVREVEVVTAARKGEAILVKGASGGPFKVGFDEVRR